MSDLITADLQLTDNPRDDQRYSTRENERARRFFREELIVFSEQRSNARRRGIDFRLTFRQWIDIWVESGHYHRRGRTYGSYVMGRLGDRGAYEVGNVAIIPIAQNVRDSHSGKEVSTQTRRIISKNAKRQKRNREGNRWST